jgi:hypothetical protein
MNELQPLLKDNMTIAIVLYLDGTSRDDMILKPFLIKSSINLVLDIIANDLKIPTWRLAPI